MYFPERVCGKSLISSSQSLNRKPFYTGILLSAVSTKEGLHKVLNNNNYY